MHPYTKKFEPEKISDVIGQDTAIKELKDFITNFKRNKKNAVLVYGPAGTGKTSSIYSIANELNLEMLEVNASDFRNKEQINSRIGMAAGQRSLFFKEKLILVDEVDGLSGTKDRGGIQAMIKLIEKSTYPIILTAINPWGNKFSTLRRKTDMIEFHPLEANSIFLILKKICDDEKIKYEDDVLKGLARRTRGDARAAVNDLQTLTIENNELTKNSLEELHERNKEDSIINALMKIFKTTDPKVALSAFENVKEDLNEQTLWLEENLPKEYTKPEELAEAFDKLSKADVFNRRIRRWQHWRFLVYINQLITAGIALSKEKKYSHYVQYKPTGKILKLWWAKQKSMKKKAIASKIAEKTHSSTKEVIKNTMPYFQFTFQKDKEFRENTIQELDLSKEEVMWLRK
jgi:replication factor C large subunit